MTTATKDQRKPKETENEIDDSYASFDMDIVIRLWGYLAVHQRKINLALGAALLSVLAQVAGPPLVSYAVDEGIRTDDMTVVLLGIAGFLIVQGLGAIGFRYQILLMASAGQRAIQKIRDDLFEHVNRLSISFFSRYETGRLIARVISDVEVLREAITFAVVGTFRDVLIVIGVVLSMMVINLPLTFVSLGVIAILVVVANFWRIYARKTYLRVRETNAKVNAELSESFNGVRVTQAFDRELYNYQRFRTGLHLRHRENNIRASLIAALFFPSIELIGGVATGLLVYVGGTLVLQQELSVFALLTFVLYIDQLFAPIRMLAQRYNLFQSVMAAGDKIFTLLDTPIEIRDAANAVALPQIKGQVTFENVEFKYDLYADEHILKHVNLDVPAGSTVALVGHTGAGKSTLVKLVTRFYESTQGRVLIDGYDVKQVTQASLRQQMGVVLQDTYLFAGTVMDNIRYGRLNATDEEVIEAARAIGAHDFIMQLEQGYHSEIREGGTLLSVGQKQLLSFARALLADPRILILDEATSNIDTQTEKIIQQALARLLKGRTSFVVAHRLSTIVNADMIVVMDHGEVIERGKHKELLALGGLYTGMYTMAG